MVFRGEQRMNAITDVARYGPEQVEADNVQFFTTALATEIQSARFEHFLRAAAIKRAEPYHFAHFNYEASVSFDLRGVVLTVEPLVKDFAATIQKVVPRIEESIFGNLKSRVRMTEGGLHLEFSVLNYWGGPNCNRLFQDPMSLRADDRLGRNIRASIYHLR
jgi:hypothetical protein